MQKEVGQLKIAVSSLEKEIYCQKPLSKKEIIEIILQPRVVDEEATKASQELAAEVKKLQKSILKIKKLIGG